MDNKTSITHLVVALADYDVRQLRIEKLYLEAKEQLLLRGVAAD